jgi:hypothetical protein
MRKRLLAACASLIASLTVSAHAEPSLPGFANEVLGNRVVSGRALKKAPVKTVKAGDLEVKPEITTLTVIAARFGGTIQHHGDAGDSTYWLCYLTPGKEVALTFASGEIWGDEHAVTVISIENSAASSIEGCSAAPAGLTGLDFGIPGLGSKLGAITRALGREKPDTANRLKYNSTTASADEGSKLQTLTYRLQNDVATGVAFTQASTD